MDAKTQKTAGISLILGSALMTLTMVLHPTGGNFDHLIQIAAIATIAHAIAILSVPFVTYGFWGLSERLIPHPIARITFFIMAFGMIAVMFAAAVNGLILMDFVKSHEGSSQDTIDSLKPFFRLIRSFNHAFDFIFIGAVCISTLLWSIAILRTAQFSKLLGWLGMILVILASISIFLGFVFVDLHGFRLFIFGWVVWVIGCGIEMARSKVNP